MSEKEFKSVTGSDELDMPETKLEKDRSFAGSLGGDSPIGK